jgi:hypothetical protein
MAPDPTDDDDATDAKTLGALAITVATLALVIWMFTTTNGEVRASTPHPPPERLAATRPRGARSSAQADRSRNVDRLWPGNHEFTSFPFRAGRSHAI